MIESLFLLLSNSSTRSQSLSLYLFVFYTALSLGQLLLNVADPYSLLPYCLASSLSSLAILPIVIFTLPIPSYEHEKRFSLREIFSTSPQGFIGGTISGMVLASIYGLGPIYGTCIGAVCYGHRDFDVGDHIRWAVPAMAVGQMGRSVRTAQSITYWPVSLPP